MLTALGPVENLGQVAPDQKITFAIDGITLIYGDNGSGKSSYCRITKKICRSLSSEDLLGNVFVEGEKPKASATVSFTPDPQTPVTTIVWTDGEKGLEATRHLSVFDSRNAHLYVGERNKIGFLPPVISILERHGAHRSEMDGIFSAERKALEEGFKVALPAGYTVGGKIAGLIEGLSVKAASLPNRSDFEKLGTWESGDAAELAELEKSVGQDPTALAARATRSADNIEALVTNVELAEERLSDRKIKAIAELAANAKAKAIASALAASVVYNQPMVGGIRGSLSKKTGQSERALFPFAKHVDVIHRHSGIQVHLKIASSLPALISDRKRDVSEIERINFALHALLKVGRKQLSAKSGHRC